MVCKKPGERRSFNLPPPAENEWSVSSSYNPSRPVPAVQGGSPIASPKSSPKGRSGAMSPPLSPGSGGTRRKEGLAQAVHEALVIPQQSLYSQGSFASTTSTLPPDYHEIEGEKAVWDIIAMIRNKNADKKAEARRYSVIKQHCQMYDKTNSGLVPVRMFKAALELAEIFLPANDFRRVETAYSNQKRGGLPGIHWESFIADVSSANFVPPAPLRTRAHTSPPREAGAEVLPILDVLRAFYKQRRVNVRDAFSDFVRPSRFCRTLERVTPTQFDEALSHSISGLTTVSVDDRALIAAAYTDPAGLIKFREFVSDMDPTIEPRSGLTIPGGFSPDRAEISPMNTAASGTLGSPGSSRIASPSLGNTHGSFVETPFGNEAQTFGPQVCQYPATQQRMNSKKPRTAEEIILVLRNACMVFNIILVDQLRLPDKHSEGTITEAQFRRLMSQLRCFELSDRDMTVLLDEFAVRVSPSDVRFNYVKFCSELQPMGPRPGGGLNAEELPRDKRSTSPLVVQKLDPEDDKIVGDVMGRVASNLRNRRSTFRQCFEDFDRTTKTRSGTTPNNFTISPGTITRTQFRQALRSMGCSDIISDQELFLLFKKYERKGEFNQIMFIRDMEDAERDSWIAMDLNATVG